MGQQAQMPGAGKAAPFEGLLSHYQQSFSQKTFAEENDDHDVLMDVFGITPEQKRENRQYYGRELGMCFQRMVMQLCERTRDDYAPGVRIGRDEPNDVTLSGIAIDTKYRLGSGDAGTLKKFRQYAKQLQEMGYRPVLLLLREDNLPQAVKACASAGWEVYAGARGFAFLEDLTGFDLRAHLASQAMRYPVDGAALAAA